MVVMSLSCPSCAARCELAITQVVVGLTAPDTSSQVLFRCASCSSAVVRRLRPGLATVLREHGATTLLSSDVTPDDAEDASPDASPDGAPGHPERPPVHAGPLTLDDLLDLHELLQDGAALAAFLAEDPA